MGYRLLLMGIGFLTGFYGWGKCQSGFPALAPSSEIPAKVNYSQPRLVFNTYQFTDTTHQKTRVEVYWAFVNDLLQFVKQADHTYQAKYEINLELTDAQQNYVTGHSQGQSITVNQYEMTNSDVLSNQGAFTFVAGPGEYAFRLELVDLDTQKRLSRKKEITLRPFLTGKTQLSDMIFLQKLGPQSSYLASIPNLTAHYRDSLAACTVYFEIYPRSGVDSVSLRTQILDSYGQPVYQVTQVIAADSQIIPRFFNFKKLIHYPGRYTLVIQNLENPSDPEQSQRFFINWSGFLPTFSNLEETLEPIEVIGTPVEWREIKKASVEQQPGLLNEFWKKRDPTPATETNEIKDEFYRRVTFCNQTFTVHLMNKPGWNTDRGRIFLKYGEPSQVQKQMNEYRGDTYEIWYYESIQRRFIFVDRSDSGDYQLLKME